MRSRTPNRHVSRLVSRVPAGASKIQLPLVRKGALPAAVDELTSSCVGHWFAMLYEPGSGGMFGSPSTGSLKPPYSGRHAAFTPPAPGAPHETTL